MPKVIITHGTMGSPQGNWFPWLSKQLRDRDYKVIVPEYPTPEGQDLNNWLKTFEKVAGALDQETILIGHSVGATFVLRVLESLKSPVRCAYLIAGFTAKLGLPEYDTLCTSFVDPPFDWEKIKTAAARFRVISGADDPYVPIAQGEGIARSLGVPLTSIHGGGHLNAESGYLQFDYLLNDILGAGTALSRQ